MIYGLCQGYQALPESGGVMDQPVWVLRMHAILAEGGHFEHASGGPPPDVSEFDPMAGIPMTVLGG